MLFIVFYKWKFLEILYFFLYVFDIYIDSLIFVVSVRWCGRLCFGKSVFVVRYNVLIKMCIYKDICYFDVFNISRLKLLEVFRYCNL